MSTKGVALRYRKNVEYSGKERKNSSIDQLNKINWYSNKRDLGSRYYPVENT